MSGPFDFDLPNGESAQEKPLPLPPKRKSREAEKPPQETDVASELTGRVLAEGQASGLVTTTLAPPANVDDTVKGYTVPMPKRVRLAIDRRGTEENRSLKYYVLRGLQLQGFPVKDEDLEDNRGAFLKRVAAARRLGKIEGE